jgi:hypothetical protein
MPGSVTVKELFLKSNHQESGTIVQGPLIVNTRDKTPVSDDKFTTYVGGYSKFKTPCFKMYRSTANAYFTYPYNSGTLQSVIHDASAITAPTTFDQNPTENEDYGANTTNGYYTCPVTGFWQLNFSAHCLDNATLIPGFIPAIESSTGLSYRTLHIVTADAGRGIPAGAVFCAAVNNAAHDHKQIHFSTVAYVKKGERVTMYATTGDENEEANWFWMGGQISGYLLSHEEDDWA